MQDYANDLKHNTKVIQDIVTSVLAPENTIIVNDLSNDFANPHYLDIFCIELSSHTFSGRENYQDLSSTLDYALTYIQSGNIRVQHTTNDMVIEILVTLDKIRRTLAQALLNGDFINVSDITFRNAQNAEFSADDNYHGLIYSQDISLSYNYEIL